MKVQSPERWFDGQLPTIRSAGFMQFDPVWATREHAASGLEVLHILRGRLSLEMRGGPFHAGPGDTLMVPPGSLHRDRFDPGTGLELFHMSLVWKPALAYARQVGNRRLLALEPESKVRVGRLFDQLRSDFGGTGENDRILARARVLALLAFLLREMDPRPVPATGQGTGGIDRHRRLMQQAKSYLERHLGDVISLDDIAAALNVSSYHLCHVFREESEFSLFAYLTAIRMDKARALLRDGRLSIKEVAQVVGYENASYFARVFRKACGCAPVAYREGRTSRSTRNRKAAS